MRRGFRKLTAGVAVATVALLSVPLVGSADERDDWQRKQREAQEQSSVLEEQLTGLDESLKQLYRDLEEVRNEIPGARDELAAAQSEAAAAQRKLTQVNDRLELAKDELSEIETQVSAADKASAEHQSAIASAALHLYRGGEESSPLLVAMAADSTADIAERTAAAQGVARAQNLALESAREALATQRSRQARQEALTERVTSLQKEAQQSATLANQKQEAAGVKLANLHELEETESARAKQVEGNKAEAREQLQAQQAVVDQARANIARIDEENRRRQLELQRQQAAAQQPAAPPPAGGKAPATSGIWGYPLPQYYPVTSPFGYRYHPVLGQMLLHAGTDLGAPCGTPALAGANAVVTDVNYHNLAGNYVRLNYGMVGGNSYQAIYMHLSAQYVSVGQHVSRGQTLGLVGTTGASTGCHLHYEFVVNGQPVDAMGYM